MQQIVQTLLASHKNKTSISKKRKNFKLLLCWLGTVGGCTLLTSTVAVAAANQHKPPLLTPVPNTVFLCKDAGQDIYTNTKLNKDCKGFVLAPPATANKPSPPPSPPIANATPTVANFPKVSTAVQNERDSDRKRILSEEMLAEQKSLDLAKKELTQQEAKALSEEKNYKKITERLQPFKDVVARHERNVQALRKEMINVK